MALVRSLPHIWESREILIPELSQDETYRKALQECVIKALVFLCNKIDAVPNRDPAMAPEYIQLGVDFTPMKSTEEMLDQIRTFLS